MSNLTPPDPLQQLRNELNAIVREVERLTGRKSNWSGRVVVGTELTAVGLAAYLGAKLWNCDIAIHQFRVNTPGKYSTLIHEAFHSVSQGLKQPDFSRKKAWEEGIVEQCTRLHCSAILQACGLPPPPDVRTSYDRQLALLENLRVRTNKTQAEFSMLLLATELIDREDTVLQWIQQAEPTKMFAQILQETDLLRQELNR